MTDIWNMLNEVLQKEVNSKLSPQMREKFEGNLKGYFRLRADLEDKVILETSWLGYWKDTDVSNLTVDVSTLNDSELYVLHWVLIQSLKQFVDSDEENDSACVKLREFYDMTYAEQCRRHDYYPSGRNGFEEY
ncbi:hypothetical protein MUP77_13720, partial [Candidatus Bathyarchaeota archaeon]|nr:hypothetical protein [Candidatus Bathyarchaeota archaeon]